MEKGKLGFGCMRLPLVESGDAIDIEQCKEMVDEYLSAGFTYFDTAWMYCNFQSENAVREMLVDRYPRSAFEIADKLHAEYIGSKADRDKVFDEQLRKTGAGYFDYYLLHAMNVEHEQVYRDLDCFDWLIEKKASGQVKEIGFSFHDSPEFLDKVLTEHPEMDFVQLMINYLDWEDEKIQSRRLYEIAFCKHKKPIVVMEPVRGGKLARLPIGASRLLREVHPDWSEASWAIRFAAGFPGVRVVLSGMSTVEQMRDNISYMKDFRRLTQEEMAILCRVPNWIRVGGAASCTGCAYCVSKCPRSINIPEYFSLYAIDKEKNAVKYDAVCQKGGRPADCIGCGACEKICPQRIEIRKELLAAAQYFITGEDKEGEQ